MTMAASIEGRVPLLDHTLVEWAFAIPGERKMRNGVRKGLLKRWLRDVLPPQLLRRPKWGFGAPVHFWMTRLDREAVRLIDARPRDRDATADRPAAVRPARSRGVVPAVP
jgi:asparagine synthase (glutamine-hydrolysing)